MNVKSILLFVGGLVTGGAAGVFGTRKYYQNKYQKQYEDDHAALEEYYHRTDEYIRKGHDEEEEFEDDGINSPESDSRPGGRMTPEERAAIKEKLNRNWEGTTNYAGFYKEKNNSEIKMDLMGGDPADSEHPEEDVPINCQNCFYMSGGRCAKGREEFDCNASFVDCNGYHAPYSGGVEICGNCAYYDEETGYCSLVEESVNEDDSCSDFKKCGEENSIDFPDEEAFDEHQKNKNKPPRIISEEAYSNLSPSVDQKTLYFYTEDEVLTDENEEMLDDPETYVGDALTKYGFNESEEMIIFVMNYALDTCYEIQKVDASWSDTH